MDFIQEFEPDTNKPIIIAAMQDMGDVGSIVIDFINEQLHTKKFRVAKSSFPTYVLDKGGHIEIPDESWEYRYSKDIIVFGGNAGQPRLTDELHALCQDVIDIAKKYSAKLVYTVGGFHTNRIINKNPKAYITTTSRMLTDQMKNLGIDITPQDSIISGFNGLILGYAKLNGLDGIGIYGELNSPEIPQYRAAKTIISTLERLTYQSFGSTAQFETLAEEIENKIHDRWSG